MKKTMYAYLDKGGILHISNSYDTAKNYSKNGKVIETTVPAEHGYPIREDGEGVIVYSETEMKITADGACIEVIPELAALYTACK